MKIKIREQARNLYVTYQMHTYKQAVNWEWADKMEAIQGQVIEVETEHLFANGFNTPPIPGVSDNGLRVMANMVEEVIDDVRPGMMKCAWCFNNEPVADVCSKCGKTEYREEFVFDVGPVVPRMVRL
jgi:hypothetical protein